MRHWWDNFIPNSTNAGAGKKRRGKGGEVSPFPLRERHRPMRIANAKGLRSFGSEGSSGSLGGEKRGPLASGVGGVDAGGPRCELPNDIA